MGVGALAVLVTVLIAFKLTIQLAVGADWDTYSFVANAAHWAGKGYGYTELFRPPLISLLASLPMRLGFEGPAVLQSLDAGSRCCRSGRSTCCSAAGSAYSAPRLAVLILLASPPLWRWVGAGYTDLAAMGLCAVSLLFVLKAGDEDARWYIVAFPVFLAAGLMRHTSLLFGFSLAVAVLLRVQPVPPRQGDRTGPCRHRRDAAAVRAVLPAHIVGHALYPFSVSAATRAGDGLVGRRSHGDRELPAWPARAGCTQDAHAAYPRRAGHRRRRSCRRSIRLAAFASPWRTADPGGAAGHRRRVPHHEERRDGT